MGPHLTYRPREGVVFGTVAGKSIRLTTLRNQGAADIYDLEQGAGAPHGRARCGGRKAHALGPCV
jgi:hypothetical protein